MLFRFSEVDLLDNGKYDYDNAKLIGTIEHKDYVEYTKLLHYMQSEDIDMKREWGNVELVDDENDELPNTYSIIDISLRIPLDKTNLECVEVYVFPNF